MSAPKASILRRRLPKSNSSWSSERFKTLAFRLLEPYRVSDHRLARFTSKRTLLELENSEARGLRGTAHVRLAVAEAICLSLLKSVTGLFFDGEQDDAAGNEPPCGAAEGGNEIAAIDERISTDDKVVRDVGFIERRVEVGRDQPGVNVPSPRLIDHFCRKIHSVQPAAKREILEGIAGQTGAAAEIENVKRRGRIGTDTLQKRAQMFRSAVRERLQHRRVVIGGVIVEQRANGMGRDTVDAFQLEKRQHPVVLRNLEVRFQRKRPIEARYGIFEPAHRDEGIAAIVPADRVVGINREHSIKRVQRFVEAVHFQKRGRAA